MKPTENIERLMQSVRVKTSTSVDDRILTDSIEALAKASHEPPATGRILKIGRFIMHNRTARFAAAAVVIAAVGFAIASLTVLNQGVSTAYAFERTVQAMHSVRSFHLACEPTEGGHPGEIWAEFDAGGRVLRCRMDFPQTEDGPKVVLWRDGKASVWLKAKNAFVILADQRVAKVMMEMAYARDPKLMVSRLEQEQAKGLVQVQTQASPAAGQPITLTATYLPASGDNRRYVLAIDPQTNLVQQVEASIKRGEQYQFADRTKVLAYNTAVDPDVFDPKMPQDVMRVDQTTQQIGLPQGNMTDQQVAQEVVRQFFQALMDKDYAKAGQLYSGIPASKMEELFSHMHIVRIVSIGEPTPRKESDSLRVPVTVEVEKDGQVQQWSPFGPFVRQVESNSTRWQIIGGI
jgi:hypothetical protein